jgi:hypothetical protein
MACIQFCPKRAINYKDRTQNRRRYTHPDIKYTDLAMLNGKVDPKIVFGSKPFSPDKKKSGSSIVAKLMAKAIWKIYGL